MQDRLEILLAGFGGQGIITTAIILGRAAILEGFTACQTQSYGTESRGGHCRANLVLEDGEIVGSPIIEAPDYFVAFSQAAYDSYLKMARGAWILYDSVMVQRAAGTDREISLPATTLATEELGVKIAANSVMLGAMVRLMNAQIPHGFVITPEITRQALTDVFPKKHHDVNLRGFDLGWQEIVQDEAWALLRAERAK
jgi:2-oxoglutarate ferredoxin oxidoreductase subunit gamma